MSAGSGTSWRSSASRAGSSGGDGTNELDRTRRVIFGRPRVEWVVAGLFGVTAVAGLALLVVYILGGQTQAEGLLLGIALGCLGLGVVLWTQELMNTPIVVEERHKATSTDAETAEFQAALTEEAGCTRRKLIVGMLLASVGGLGALPATPAPSLGPAPGVEQC